MFLKSLGFRRSKHTISTRRQYPTVIEELCNCHQFSLADLRKSTNIFDEKRVIGRGPIGCVYIGSLQHNGASDYTVAIKRLHASINGATQEWKNEIELLCQLRHPNLVSLIGFCNHKIEKILVYEYMSNGSLDKHLQPSQDMEPLTWKKRLEICIGAARGLHYLHAGAKRTILHRSIQPSSILLDDAMEPKLAGFGLSRQGPHFMSKPKPIAVDPAGTLGYIAMEHLRHGTLTDKCDVYSFGIVLLQVVSGMRFLDMFFEIPHGMIKPVEEIIDPNIKGKIAPECWQAFIDITQTCLKYEPDERPAMGEVELQLEHALLLQEQADIRNTNAAYTLFSTTIVNPGLEPESNSYSYSEAENDDIEDM